MDMNKNLITIVASVGLSALAAFGIVKAATPSDIDSDLTYTPAGVTRTVNLAMSDYPDFTYAAETAVEAVVYVQVTATTPQSDYIDPFFRFFFGDGYSPRERVRQGSGSGVIVREDGYIVTNNHVISGATDIKVTLNNNRTYNATIVGSDPATDVALIKIDAKGLPVLQFADSDKLRLGEWVLAIGSPLGEELRSTITAGIVSAKGRRMNGYDGSLKIESFIHTDAAVNPVPRKVWLYGAEYTPQEFAASVCLPSDYEALTSYTHEPFGSDVVLAVPANREGYRFRNVPVDTLVGRVVGALRSGRSVCWEGDISNDGFSFERGVAELPKGSPVVTQAARQQAFERFSVTDDHCMAIVGLARDAAGRRWFICKNSWVTDNPYGGLMYMSEQYFRLNTLAVVMLFRS